MKRLKSLFRANSKILIQTFITLYETNKYSECISSAKVSRRKIAGKTSTEELENIHAALNNCCKVQGGTFYVLLDYAKFKAGCFLR